MAKHDLPDAELLRKLLRYDPETGKLYWRERTPDMFKPGNNGRLAVCKAWNAKFAGKEAMNCKNSKGYLTGGLLGLRVLTHHVVWKIHHGSMPSAQIDHINGDKTDNRATNLRGASSNQNQRNKGRYSNNTSGYKGVFYSASSRKWAARIHVNGERIYLGVFPTREQAHQAYCRASDKYHGEFGRVA